MTVTTTHPGPHGVTGEYPLLDIGGDIGAIVVRLDAVPPTGELEARPRGRPDRRFHTGVHLREVGGRAVPVALYPEVAAGPYEILGDAHEPVLRVDAIGGEVVEVALQGPFPAGS